MAYFISGSSATTASFGHIEIKGTAVNTSGGGVTISNNSANRVLTGDGSNAAANTDLTWNGTKLSMENYEITPGGTTTFNSADEDINTVISGFGGSGAFTIGESKAHFISQNVGIGVTNPGVALEVNGSVSGSSTSTGSFGKGHFDGHVGIGTDKSNSDQYTVLHLDANGADNNLLVKQMLSINGTLQGSLFGFQNAIGFLDSDNSYAYRHITDGIHEWRSNNSEKMRLTSTGFLNIGIVSTGPDTPLHVSEGEVSGITSNTDAMVTFEKAGSVGNNNYLQFLTDNDRDSGIIFGDEDNNNVARINYKHTPDVMSIEHGGTVVSEFTSTMAISGSATSTGSFGLVDSDHGIRFGSAGAYKSPASIRSNSNLLVFQGGTSGYQFKDDNNSATHIAIDSSGNVGIGTTSPDTNLHIHKASAGSISGHTDAQLVVENSGMTGINLLSGASSHGQIMFGDSGDADKGVIGYDQSADRMYILTNGSNTKRFSVESDGDIGINTTSPAQQLAGANRVVQIKGELVLEDGAGNSTFLALGGAHNARNYVYSTGNIPLDIATNSLVRMTILGDGKVGIGTNVPERLLHLRAASPSIMWEDTDVSGLKHQIIGGGNAGLEISVDINNTTTGYFRVDVGGTEKMRLVESGNLGIGTNSPSGQNASGPILHLFGQNTSGTLSEPQIVFQQTGEPAMSIGANANLDSGAAMLFQTNGSNIRMVILEDGKVGIGDNTPEAKLEIGISDTTAYSATGLTLDPQAYDALFLDNSANGNMVAINFKVNPTGAGMGRIILERTTTNDGDFVFQLRDPGASTTSKERMRIAGDGHITMGSTDTHTKINGLLTFTDQGSWTSETAGSIRLRNNILYVQYGTSGLVLRAPDGANAFQIDSADNTTFRGHVNPGSDAAYNLGSEGSRWANVFSADLQLSNEGTEGNEVDGTTGSWTIQEGNDDLYLLNRKNGKKYRFKLEEII